ncbi:hypothetical protein Tco_0826480 [Tanacetum coccineum]
MGDGVDGADGGDCVKIFVAFWRLVVEIESEVVSKKAWKMMVEKKGEMMHLGQEKFQDWVKVGIVEKLCFHLELGHRVSPYVFCSNISRDLEEFRRGVL